MTRRYRRKRLRASACATWFTRVNTVIFAVVTMADVARLAGVSVTTVSHVINGTRPASERTRSSVLAAIERTGYRPNTIARALARGGTQSLGLAISGLSNPYFMDVVAAIEPAAGRAGPHAAAGRHARGPRARAADRPHAGRAPGRRDAAGADRRARSSTRCPYLEPGHAGRAARPLRRRVELDQVGCDNEQPTARLVEHLIDLGHRRIAMAIGIPGLCTTDERVRGYRLALEQAGIAFDPRAGRRGRLAARPGARRDARAARSRRPADRGRLAATTS